MLLVGTKTDLRHDASVLQELRKLGEAPITHQQGNGMAVEVGAVGYVECSALTQKGLKEVFDRAVEAVVDQDKPKKIRRGCVVL